MKLMLPFKSYRAETKSVTKVIIPMCRPCFASNTKSTEKEYRITNERHAIIRKVLKGILFYIIIKTCLALQDFI